MRSPSRQARRAGVRSRLVALVGSVAPACRLVPAATVVPVLASHTTAPTSVTIAGSLQSELGCPGGLAAGVRRHAPHLRRDRQVWQGTFAVPSAAAPYEYKAALNDAWTENYGANATFNGGNIGLTVGDANATKFYYSHDSHWVTSNRNAVDRDGRRQLPERDRLPGRLAARLPAVVAPGPGRQRRLHVRQRRDPGRRLRDEGGPQRGLGRLLSRLECRVHGRRGRGRHDHLHGLDERRHRRQRAAPGARHDGRPRRQPPGGARLPGRLAARMRGHRADPRGRRRLARRLHRARRQLGVQGRPERHVGRQLRGRRGLERREHRADAGRRDRGAVLLRRHDPLGHEQPQRDDRHGGRQLPERDRLPGRLGARLPALVAPGHRRRTASTPSSRTTSRPATTSSRSPSTRPGTRPIPADNVRSPSRAATPSRSRTRRPRTPSRSTSGTTSRPIPRTRRWPVTRCATT